MHKGSTLRTAGKKKKKSKTSGRLGNKKMDEKLAEVRFNQAKLVAGRE